jgi:hypothetical protein
MTHPIEKRCERRVTHGFVAAETVDHLAEKMVGVIGDRRISVMHRYLGERAGTPSLVAGYRLWHGGISDAITRTPGHGVSVCLRGPGDRNYSVRFSVGPHEETEEQARERYHHPEEQFLGQRREITLVMVQGFPGEPHPDDRVRIETWDENGVGEEKIVAFDPIDPFQEVAWDVKGDRVRYVQFHDEFCDTHGLHFENPDHRRSGCSSRQSTSAEDLAVLAYLAQLNERR